MKESNKKKRRKRKITAKWAIKWLFIVMVCLILLAAMVARVHHFFSVHVK